MTDHRVLVSLVLALAVLPIASGGEVLENVCATILDADGGAPRGCYPSGYSGSRVEVLKDGPRRVRVVLSEPHQKLLWNFAQHRRLTPAEFASDPMARFRMRLRSGTDVSTRLEFGWALTAGTLSTATSCEVQLRAGEPQNVVFPLPAAPEGKVQGFYLGSREPATLILETAAVVSQRQVVLDPLDRSSLLHSTSLELRGRTVPGVEHVTIKAHVAGAEEPCLTREVPVSNGAFVVTIQRSELPVYTLAEFAAALPGANDPAAESLPQLAYVFPEVTGARPPRLCVEDGRLMRDGKPFAFVGLNYTRFQMSFCRSGNWETIARDARDLHDWGVRFVRLTLNMSMIQAAEGVFPDDPRWEPELASRRLNTEFMDMLDYFLRLLAQNGIYAVFDWHERPTGPYRYFVGGNNHDKGSGKPGTAIAWLCPDKTKGVRFDVSEPRHLQALLSTHEWMARRYREQTNVVGIEVPYNEPHRKYMSNQANWSRVVAQCCRAVKLGAPEMLTFSNNPNYAHNTEAWAFTWMNPFGLDGQGPHHYIANGPVPVRPEAKETRMPWLCRDREQTFAVTLPALFLASYVWRQPIYNGEGGEHGAAELLPELERALAEEHMYEASLAQCYAAGVVGHVNWTMLGTRANTGMLAKHGARYAPVMAAGPVDWSRADVAVIQSTEAVSTGNGHNFACVPFAELMLALHLGPVHYLSDDYLIFNGLTRQSAGLEQVTGSSVDLSSYKVVVADRRNLDVRVARLLEATKGTPILWVDDMAELGATELATFLSEAGVAVDTRTPAGIQLAVGPQHVVVFRRRGEGGRDRIYPRVSRDGRFRLVDESGNAAFEGTADELSGEGMEVELGRWRSAIFEIKRQ